MVNPDPSGMEGIRNQPWSRSPSSLEEGFLGVLHFAIENKSSRFCIPPTFLKMKNEISGFILRAHLHSGFTSHL